MADVGSCPHRCTPTTSSFEVLRPRARRDDADDSHSTDCTDFSHPVYKKISQINGEINKLGKDELREQLQSLDMDTRFVNH